MGSHYVGRPAGLYGVGAGMEGGVGSVWGQCGDIMGSLWGQCGVSVGSV